MAGVDDQAACVRFRDWLVRPVERVLQVRGQTVAIGSRAFDVLMVLVARRGRLVSRNELIDAAWPGLVVEENNLSVQISALRKLLGPQAITTLPGLGYRLSAAPADADEAAGAPAPAAGAAAAMGAASAPSGNLPALLPRLFGRDDDIATLCRRCAEHRLVSIMGAGGIGKTRLAVAVAAAQRERFAGGVWLVELAPLADAALLPAAVAQALGLSLPGSRAPQDEVITAMGDAPRLLVLDNCEHVIEVASAFVQAVLAGTTRVHVLATSQETLKLADEHVHRTAPLALPGLGDSLDQVRQAAAARLLVERVAAQQPGFVLDSGNADDVAEICRQLDGLPLAIELAAGRVPLLGLAGVRQRLGERLRLLTGGSRTGLARHRALRETLAWSHGLLTPDEATVFRRAGVFMGGFGLDHAHDVLGDERLDEWAVLDLLGRLVDKSLVMVEPGEPPRYRLLESARAFALEQLVAHGEADAVRARHVQLVLTWFEGAQALQWTLPSQQRLERFLPDLDNCRAALDVAARGPAVTHVALAGACAWLFAGTGQGVEGRRHAEAAMARLDDGIALPLQARLRVAWCALAHDQPTPERRAAAEQAVAQLRQAGDDPAALYSALGRLAITVSLCGDGEAGERAVAEMATLWQPSWPPLARWDLLNARDYVANMLGRVDEGMALAHEQLALAQAHGDVAKTMFAMMAMEQCTCTLGDYAQAVSLGRRLVAFARGARFVERMQVFVGNLATALVRDGQLDEGLAVAREAAELDRRSDALWLSLDLFALLALKRGRPAVAAQVIGRSDAANAWRGAFREPVEAQLRDEVMQTLQATLPAAELAALLAAGAAMSDDAATRLALAD